MEFVKENERTLPLRDACDVLVAGGGIAGAAAALAAARQGRSVLLVEREYMLGGLGTAGLVTIYLPIDDGAGHQVCYGIAEELLRLALPNALEDRYPALWLRESSAEERRAGQRFELQYNAQMYALELERLLLENGVRILYGTVVCGTEVLDERIRYVTVENKSGRSAIRVRSVIDCSGDADVCALCGAPTRLHAAKNPQANWYYHLDGGKLRLNCLGACDDSGEATASDEQRIGEERVSGIDGWENSLFVQRGHRAMRSDILARRARGESCVPVTMPTIPELRMTRCMEGVSVMTRASDRQFFADSVGLFPDWSKRGPIYELPFSALRTNAVKNLLVAGRCVSTDDAMWNVTRVIPVCAVTGEAAGTAAGLTDDFTQIDMALLQRTLQSAGVRLHTAELGIQTGEK